MHHTRQSPSLRLQSVRDLRVARRLGRYRQNQLFETHRAAHCCCLSLLENTKLNDCLSLFCLLMRNVPEGHWSFPRTDASGEDDPTDVEARAAAGRASNDEAGARVSDSAVDLIRGALQVDRAARLSAEALLKHRWLQQDNAVSTAALSHSVVAAVRARTKRQKTLASQHMTAWDALPRDGA